MTVHGIELPKGSLLIGDGRVARTDTGVFEQIDPSTGEVLAPITLAGAREIDDAVRAANGAEADWRALAPARRRDLILALADKLDEHHEELSILRSLELGAPKKKGKGTPPTGR